MKNLKGKLTIDYRIKLEDTDNWMTLSLMVKLPHERKYAFVDCVTSLKIEGKDHRFLVMEKAQRKWQIDLLGLEDKLKFDEMDFDNRLRNILNNI